MAEKSERAEREEKVLKFWEENQIFDKTLEKKAPKGDFVFYEGPPTANGRPAIHHLEARAFKDAIPRYKTMRGFSVPRKAGWDTHGLPVELEVEKNLDLKSKKDIEAYGIDKFNKKCKESVFKYIDEWEKFTDRIGYWVDKENAYYTFEPSYIESVWSILSHVDKENLLYKDYKVVPWCPRCGTALSSHELAQGYKDVKDLSVIAKFKIKDFPNAYFLAWTTTPWTLPGNLALAVGEDVDYVEAKIGQDVLVLAKDRLSILEEPYEILAEHKGKDMVGMSYEPLYPFLEGKSDKSFKVYSADFVNTEDGTGIVHTAVMYGQDDFELGTKVDLPKHHLVDESGHFIDEAGFLAGKFVRDEETAVDIIKDLAHRGLLFKKEKYEHSYPFCWRCKTALIYYARDSWYIRMSLLRDRLVKENQKINWEPEHIKEGRFGEWLREVKDWAISRERYWGTPLPIWEAGDGSKRIVVDSLDTLKKYTKRSGNKYFLMRHGEARHNVENVLDLDGDPENHLTERGRKNVQEAGKRLSREKVDLIFASPFLRTRETAEILLSELGLPKEALILDPRIQETQSGEEDQSVRRRVAEFMFDIDSKHRDKNVVIVSHAGPIWRLSEMVDRTTGIPPEVGEVRDLDFFQFPHNEEYELDLHRPYIDDFVLEKDGESYKRVKEVLDVWFDSGAMPFASTDSLRYPADFISEAIDQTRGWFYTLHAVGNLMGKGLAFKNAICLGHLLDKDGKKMSKSVGNVVDPWEEINEHGVDALRLWMYSVNQSGDSKNYDPKVVNEIGRKVFNILDNVYAFYDLYRDREMEAEGVGPSSENVLDKWIMSRLNLTIELMTDKLDSYKLFEPARAVEDFINDLSTWYLRRSRERIKNGDKDALATLYFVLRELSKALAPLAPFMAEDLYQKIRTKNDVESVHLSSWPEGGRVDESLLNDMKDVRDVVSSSLREREKANIKVRQPLGKLEITASHLSSYLDLIKDEVNVKDVVFGDRLFLDTTITPELEEEGKMREVIRGIQDLRKEKGLKPGDKLKIDIPESDKDIFTKFSKEIQEATNTEF